MKLSLSWIRDYVNIPEDADLKKLAYDLTMSTVEVEDVEYLAERFENMIVGVIEKIEPHPNADRLRVCKVNIGSDEIKDIVCGGINLEEGMRVAVSCPGAVVRWHGEGEPVVIKNSKLRGVESFGMICASDEIGLGELFPSETEGEILDAIHRPLGATTLDGIKRRTRAGMGRCQAGFCSPRQIEILARELGVDQSEIRKSGRDSKFIVGTPKDRL